MSNILFVKIISNFCFCQSVSVAIQLPPTLRNIDWLLKVSIFLPEEPINPDKPGQMYFKLDSLSRQIRESRTCYSAKSFIPFSYCLVTNGINVVKSGQFFCLNWVIYFMVGFMELVGVFWAIEYRVVFELLPVCKVLILGGALFCR